MPLVSRASARKGRRGFTLIELLVVVVIIGILASVAAPQFNAAQDRARNTTMAGNLRGVQTCLEQYAADNNGAYPGANYSPPRGRRRRGSARRGTAAPFDGLEEYLPGDEMPKAPWCLNTQEQFLAPSSPLTSARNVADGEELLTPIGRQFTSSGKVADQPTRTDHFGAIAYGYASDDQVYVVYALGKKGKAVIVAGSLSNLGGAAGD